MTKTPQDDADARVVRPFADWLLEQSQGKSHAELGEGLHDLIARVLDTGKKGSLQFTVYVQTGDVDNMLVVTDEIRLRLPEYARKASVFWQDENGNLVRNDPNQMSFESLKEVPPINVDIATGEIREVKSL